MIWLKDEAMTAGSNVVQAEPVPAGAIGTAADDDLFSGLLRELAEEYREIMEADQAFQSHRLKWLMHAARWMRQQKNFQVASQSSGSLATGKDVIMRDESFYAALNGHSVAVCATGLIPSEAWQTRKRSGPKSLEHFPASPLPDNSVAGHLLPSSLADAATYGVPPRANGEAHLSSAAAEQLEIPAPPSISPKFDTPGRDGRSMWTFKPNDSVSKQPGRHFQEDEKAIPLPTLVSNGIQEKVGLAAGLGAQQHLEGCGNCAAKALPGPSGNVGAAGEAGDGGGSRSSANGWAAEDGTSETHAGFHGERVDIITGSVAECFFVDALTKHRGSRRSAAGVGECVGVEGAGAATVTAAEKVGDNERLAEDVQGQPSTPKTRLDDEVSDSYVGRWGSRSARFSGRHSEIDEAHGDADDDSSDDEMRNRSTIRRKLNDRLSGYDVPKPVDEELDKPAYDVSHFYHTSGLAQRIARSDVFGNVTLTIIALNAIYIGVDADLNDAASILQAELGFQICETTFCIFFTFEWCVRFAAFKLKRDCLRDMWFKFDSALVMLMIVETWIFSSTGLPTGMVKLLRLLRLARMARLMRAFPELVAMIKGVREASRAVGSALMMVLLLIYIFAIVMLLLMEPHLEKDTLLEERFRTLPICMWTLFMDGTLLDGVSITSRALYKNDAYAAFFVLLLFVLMSAMTVMNMLIGVLCEVVTAVAAAEKEDAAIRLVKETVLVMLNKLDEDGSGEISKEEMNMVFDDEAALQVLCSLQVDIQHLVDYLDMWFEKQSDLSIHQIMDLILMLRGDRAPTMKDLLDREAYSMWKFHASLRDLGRQLTGTKPIFERS